MKNTESEIATSGMSTGVFAGKPMPTASAPRAICNAPSECEKLQLRLRPRGSRLKHVGDRRQTNAMSLVRRIERGGRQIQIRFLRVALRPRREISERRGLDLKNRVLDGRVVREIGGDRRLARDVDRAGAPTEIQHRVRETERRSVLRPLARRTSRRRDLQRAVRDHTRPSPSDRCVRLSSRRRPPRRAPATTTVASPDCCEARRRRPRPACTARGRCDRPRRRAPCRAPRPLRRSATVARASSDLPA